MNVTPSAISHGIKDVEKKLGGKLFIKTEGVLKLTKLGDIFYKKTAGHIEELNITIDDIKLRKKKEGTVIKMDAIHYPKIRRMVSQIISHHAKHSISIYCEAISDINEELKQGHADIIISPIDFKTDYESIAKTSLQIDRVGLLTSNKLLEKHTEIKNIIIKEKLIQTAEVMTHITFTRLMNRIGEKGFKCRFMLVNEMDLLFYIINGLGYSFCTEGFYHDYKLEKEGLTFIANPLQLELFLNSRAYFLNRKREQLEAVLSIMQND